MVGPLKLSVKLPAVGEPVKLIVCTGTARVPPEELMLNTVGLLLSASVPPLMDPLEGAPLLENVAMLVDTVSVPVVIVMAPPLVKVMYLTVAGLGPSARVPVEPRTVDATVMPAPVPANEELAASRF